jgi:cytochrome b561
MNLINSASKYGALTKFFHWTIFLLFLNQFISATIMTWIENGAFRGDLYAWHKAIGLLILFLAIARLTLTKLSRQPDWAEGLQLWEKSSIVFIERGLYIVMLLMPISGIIMSFTGGHKISFYSLFHIPGLSEPNTLLSAIGWFVHTLTSYSIIGLVSIHFAFVLRRQIFDKDGYIKRMLPFTSQK